MSDDRELLEAWRDGDEAAGRALFERHFDAIFRFFRAKLPEAAEDLTQQTFLGCVRGKDRFRGDASFRTYLFTVARNRLYTYLRDRGRRARVETTAEPAELSIADLADPSPSAIIAGRQEQRLLLEALRRLPLDLQIAIELHYWEGMTVREIALVVDTPEGTIKRRLQRARARLEDIIRELADSDVLADSTIGDLAGWAKQLQEALGGPSDPEGDKPGQT